MGRDSTFNNIIKDIISENIETICKFKPLKKKFTFTIYCYYILFNDKYYLAIFNINNDEFNNLQNHIYSEHMKLINSDNCDQDDLSCPIFDVSDENSKLIREHIYKTPVKIKIFISELDNLYLYANEDNNPINKYLLITRILYIVAFLI